MIDVSLVTISTNELNYLKDFYNTLMKYEKDTNFELIIVDNASSDGTTEWFKEKKQNNIKVFQNRKKQGFAFNNNMGIKRSKGRYVLIINPDIIFIEAVLQKLVDYMDNNCDIGMTASKLLNLDMTLQLSARRFYNYPTLFIRRSPILSNFLKSTSINKRHLYYDKDMEKIFYPNWVLGAFMMVRRSVFKEIGFLDERFQLYFEDVDFCRRIWQAGYKISYFPFTKLIHLYNRESDIKRFFQGFVLKKGAKIHLKSMIKYLFKYDMTLGQKIPDEKSCEEK